MTHPYSVSKKWMKNRGNGQAIIYQLRCQDKSCPRMLGKVDENLIVHINSKRSGIDIQLEKGTITCTKCGNEVFWEKGLKAISEGVTS